MDRVSGLFTMANFLGEVTGPVLGGLGYDAFGFAGKCLSVAMVTACYALLIAVSLALNWAPRSGAGGAQEPGAYRYEIRRQYWASPWHQAIIVGRQSFAYVSNTRVLKSHQVYRSCTSGCQRHADY